MQYNQNIIQDIQNTSFVSLFSNGGRELFFKEVAPLWNECRDSLNYSYGYFLITGRKGAWLYKDDEFTSVICSHPNIDNEYLVYVYSGKYTESFWLNVCNFLNAPPTKFKIARIHEQDVCSIAKNAGDYNFILQSEDYMDWKYPSHTFSTHKVIEKGGADLHQVRKEVRKLEEDKISFEIFKEDHLADIRMVAEAFALQFLSHNKDYSLPIHEMIQPSMDVINLCLSYKTSFNVNVLIYKGRPQGFFVWEKVTDNFANALWMLSNRNIRGLSYAHVVKACEHLNNEGFDFVNFGGSETSGMDLFKRKFKPCKSYDLYSMAPVYEEAQSYATA